MICAWVCAAGGCTTHAKRLRDGRELFHQGDLATASETLTKAECR